MVSAVIYALGSRLAGFLLALVYVGAFSLGMLGYMAVTVEYSTGPSVHAIEIGITGIVLLVNAAFVFVLVKSWKRIRHDEKRFLGVRIAVWLGVGKTVKTKISDDQWREFWHAIEEAGVWKWKSHYDDTTGICDGTQWLLELAQGERRLKTGGSNAYPGSDGMDYTDKSEYGRFRAALRKLVGGKADF